MNDERRFTILMRDLTSKALLNQFNLVTIRVFHKCDYLIAASQWPCFTNNVTT